MLDTKKVKVALGIITKKVLTGPIEVSVDLTRRCTLDCLMCWWRSPLLEKQPSSEWSNQAMDYELFKELIRDFKKLKIKRIILGGQGDPMLYPKLFEVMELTKKAGIEVALITSGFYLTEKKVRTLFDLQVDCLDVSLQAATSETYHRLHPGQRKDTFSRIKNHLMLLSKLKEEAHQNVPDVRIIHIICSLNYHETVKVIEFASEVGADSIGYKRVDVTTQTKELLLNEKQWEDFQELLNKAEKKAIELGIGTGIKTFRKFILKGLTTGIYTTDFYSQIPCYVGWNSARILETGDVIPCCGCFDVILGNIKQNSFIDIWYSDTYQKFRKQALHLDKKAARKAGCKCYSCVDYGTNLGIYGRLHPIKAKEIY